MAPVGFNSRRGQRASGPKALPVAAVHFIFQSQHAGVLVVSLWRCLVRDPIAHVCPSSLAGQCIQLRRRFFLDSPLAAPEDDGQVLELGLGLGQRSLARGKAQDVVAPR